METKQVIVIRKDLKMRKGKMISQGAHASMKVITDCIFKQKSGLYKFYPSEEIESWLNGSFTKICVSVDSEAELLKIFTLAKLAKLPCSLIRDIGKTEFKEPTNTAVAVGPAENAEIDKITSYLKLL